MARPTIIAKRCGCDCGGTTNPCDCNGPGCALECRHKSATAELCGFEEFVSPSVPPRKFRRRVLSGTMYSGTFSEPDCVSESATNISGSSTMNPAFPDAYGTVFRWSFNWTETGPGVGTLEVTLTRENGNEHWFVEYGLGISASPTGPFNPFPSSTVGNTGPGSTPSTAVVTALNIPKGHYIRLNFNGRNQFFGNAGSFPESPVVWKSGTLAQLKRDVWSSETQLSASTCAGTTEQNHQRFAGVGNFPLTTGGTLEGWAGFLYAPDYVDAYGAMVTRTSAPDRITYNGLNDCDGSGTYQKASGTITDDLLDEDSEEDAMARAGPADWVGPNPAVPCTDLPAFITERGAGDFVFGFRNVQVRAALTGLTNGHTYQVKIRLFRRVLGTGGPFLFYGELEFNHTAASAAENTAWQDVPNEAGWETKASGCTVIRI
jgi:hypothetical protein